MLRYAAHPPVQQQLHLDLALLPRVGYRASCRREPWSGRRNAAHPTRQRGGVDVGTRAGRNGAGDVLLRAQPTIVNGVEWLLDPQQHPVATVTVANCAARRNRPVICLSVVRSPFCFAPPSLRAARYLRFQEEGSKAGCRSDAGRASAGTEETFGGAGASVGGAGTTPTGVPKRRLPRSNISARVVGAPGAVVAALLVLRREAEFGRDGDQEESGGRLRGHDEVSLGFSFNRRVMRIDRRCDILRGGQC